jgi:hypothetical protein
LANTGRVLATVLKTPDEEIDEYLQVLAEMAEESGGGITDPPPDSRRLPGLGGQPDSRSGCGGGRVHDHVR